MAAPQGKTAQPSMLGRAILELLVRESLSGYDLKKRFAGSLAFGWHAQDSQIYPELKRLKQAAWVDWADEDSALGPPRRVYAITLPGLKVLTDWLNTPFEESRQKSELVLRIWAADLVPTERMLELLAGVSERTEREISTMEGIRKRLLERHGPPETSLDPAQVGPFLSVEHDLQLLRARRVWLERAVQVLRTRAANANEKLRG